MHMVKMTKWHVVRMTSSHLVKMTKCYKRIQQRILQRLLMVDQLALITLNSRRPIGWIIKNPRSLSRYAAGNGDGADPDGYP